MQFHRCCRRITIGLYLLIAQPLSAAELAPAGTIVASVDDDAITSAEIDKLIGARVASLNEQIYNLRRETIDAAIDQRLIATEALRRGLSEAQLLEVEVVKKSAAVSDGEVEAFYKANETRLPTQEANLRGRIRDHLVHQKLDARHDAFVGELRAKANISVLLTPPKIYRASLDIDGAPVLGPADAPVVIVKFEDFHCPFCKEAQQTLAKLLARYPNRIRLVYKDFPIDGLHPAARAAHLAARCANEQGRFWPYHDALYANAASSAPEALQKYARDTGLDLPRFDRCLSASHYTAAVERDIEEGKQSGVTGTPAFFINGRLLAGAQPLENFVKLVDEELAQKP